jgi:membrane dipeptidase
VGRLTKDYQAYFQLTYNLRNLVGDGCLKPGNAGLSVFGRKLISRLNERKILVDLSNAGERTTMEAIDASKGPIAITHTGAGAQSAQQDGSRTACTRR